MKKRKTMAGMVADDADAKAAAAGIATEEELNIKVSDEAAKQMSRLFMLLDKNGDGSLSAEDWEVAGDDHSKWHTLRSLFSFDQGRTVQKEEFIFGIKRLALQGPIEEDLFPELGPLSHVATMRVLNESSNRAVIKLCKQLYDEIANHGSSIYLMPETFRQLEMLWKALDVDGDGSLTANDWTQQVGGHAKWDLLRSNFDLSGSHEITKDDFVDVLKALSLKEALDPSCFQPPPATHVDLMKAANLSFNHAMQNLFKTLFEGLQKRTA